MTVANHETDYLELRRVVKSVAKHRCLIVGLVLICATVAGVVSFITPPTYEAETTIRIKRPKSLTESLLADSGTVAPLEMQQLMSTYSEILKGRTVIENTIRKVYPPSPKRPDYQSVAKRINTVQVKDTQLLKVTVRSEAPGEAALFADVLIKVFMERMRGLVSSEQRTVRDFLEKRLEHSNAELEQTKLNHNANVQLDQGQTELIADSPVIQNYKSKLAELEIKLAGLAQEYTDKHPDVIATKAEINATKNKLNLEIDRIRLLRETGLSQETYLLLDKRHEEARISEAMQPADIQVVEKAVVPSEPVAPQKNRNIILAAVLGLCAGLGLAFWLDSFHKTINSAGDVKRYLGLPVAGNIPDFKIIKRFR